MSLMVINIQIFLVIMIMIILPWILTALILKLFQFGFVTGLTILKMIVLDMIQPVITKSKYIQAKLKMVADVKSFNIPKQLRRSSYTDINHNRDILN